MKAHIHHGPVKHIIQNTASPDIKLPANFIMTANADNRLKVTAMLGATAAIKRSPENQSEKVIVLTDERDINIKAVGLPENFNIFQGNRDGWQSHLPQALNSSEKDIPTLQHSNRLPAMRFNTPRVKDTAG